MNRVYRGAGRAGTRNRVRAGHLRLTGRAPEVTLRVRGAASVRALPRTGSDPRATSRRLVYRMNSPVFCVRSKAARRTAPELAPALASRVRVSSPRNALSRSRTTRATDAPNAGACAVRFVPLNQWRLGSGRTCRMRRVHVSERTGPTSGGRTVGGPYLQPCESWCRGRAIQPVSHPGLALRPDPRPLHARRARSHTQPFSKESR